MKRSRPRWKGCSNRGWKHPSTYLPWECLDPAGDFSRDGCVYQVICGTVLAGGSGALQAGECRQPADALGNAALLRAARHWHGAGLIFPCSPPWTAGCLTESGSRLPTLTGLAADFVFKPCHSGQWGLYPGADFTNAVGELSGLTMKSVTGDFGRCEDLVRARSVVLQNDTFRASS